LKQLLEALLPTLEVTDARVAGNLQFFGLHWPTTTDLLYSTLDEAVAAGTLDLTEVSAGGEVPYLKVHNKAASLVFLMAGEQLVGAKQNRVLNVSIMVPGQSELALPVSCVEAGRWRYHSPKFASSGSTSHQRLRQKMAKHVLDGYRQTGKPSSKQGEVWQEVDRKLKAMASASPSAALSKAYEDHQQRLDAFVDQLPVPEGCHGAVFALGGRIAGMDLFDRPATLAKLWPKLIRAYAIDALEELDVPTVSIDHAVVLQWLKTGEGAKAESYKSAGLGEDVRLEGKDMVGASLVLAGHPVHLELFPKEEIGAAQ
jgi:hypothetical protein